MSQFTTKVDKIGRVQISKEDRDELLAEFEHSSLSASKFAESYGIKYSTFAGWLRQRKDDDSMVSGDKQVISELEQSLQEVTVAESLIDVPPMAESLRVSLPYGVEVCFSSASQIPLVSQLAKSLYVSLDFES